MNDDYVIVTVTWNDTDEVEGWAHAIATLDPFPRAIVVVDCASSDQTIQTLNTVCAGLANVSVVASETNLGFAGGFNLGLEKARQQAPEASWALSLNADARPEADYVGRLIALGNLDERCGALTGRLLRPVEAPEQTRTIDACGMRLVPTWRHLDRGSGRPDLAEFEEREWVFGATGAASLFRLEALDDTAIEGRILDEDFHSFREDAELCFRLRERNWGVLYEPTALCIHRRFNTPGRRATMPATVNLHSLKNRYLLRAYHQTPLNLLTTLVPATARDLMALVWVLLFERSSLPAYHWLWRNRERIRERRALIQGRRTVPASEIEGWFWRDGSQADVPSAGE